MVSSRVGHGFPPSMPRWSRDDRAMMPTGAIIHKMPPNSLMGRRSSLELWRSCNAGAKGVHIFHVHPHLECPFWPLTLVQRMEWGWKRQHVGNRDLRTLLSVLTYSQTLGGPFFLNIWGSRTRNSGPSWGNGMMWATACLVPPEVTTRASWQANATGCSTVGHRAIVQTWLMGSWKLWKWRTPKWSSIGTYVTYVTLTGFWYGNPWFWFWCTPMLGSAHMMEFPWDDQGKGPMISKDPCSWGLKHVETASMSSNQSLEVREVGLVQAMPTPSWDSWRCHWCARMRRARRKSPSWGYYTSGILTIPMNLVHEVRWSSWFHIFFISHPGMILTHLCPWTFFCL